MTNHTIFCLIFVYFILVFNPVLGINTIGYGEETNATLKSPKGAFSLGFFNIGEAGLGYLGIWYTNDEQKTKLWVANPNNPLFSNSTALGVGSDGILNIMVDGIVYFNISDQVSGNATATLEDSGNLVVYDETENKIIWQSFDHPYNALLPGMKIGYNTETKQNWSLTSWVSDSYPASGAFNLSWEPIQDSGQFVLYRRGNRYWTSGPLINQSFDYLHVNKLFYPYTYNLTSVSNSIESYFTFNYNSSVALSAWLLEPNGSINDLSTNQVLGVPNFCYGYELNDGCVVSKLPPCRGYKDKFTLKRAYFSPSSADPSYDTNSSLGISDCMKRCWSICDCVGFSTYYGDNDTGCTNWIGKLKYGEDSVYVYPIYVLDLSDRPKEKSKTRIVIVGVIAYIILKKWRRKKEEKQKRKEYLKELINSDSFKITSDNQDDSNELNMISFASILEATNNFSNENKLGEGGFGPVYKVPGTDGVSDDLEAAGNYIWDFI